jgi:hypothetical protein
MAAGQQRHNDAREQSPVRVWPGRAVPGSPDRARHRPRWSIQVDPMLYFFFLLWLLVAAAAVGLYLLGHAG